MDLRWYVADGCRPTIEWFILFCVCVCVCHCIAKVLFVLVWCDDLLGAMHLHLILFREISISTWNKNEPFRFQFPDPVWRCRDLIKSSIDNLVWRIFCLSSMQMHMSHVLTARELVNRPINRIQSIGSAAVGECVCVCVPVSAAVRMQNLFDWLFHVNRSRISQQYSKQWTPFGILSLYRYALFFLFFRFSLNYLNRIIAEIDRRNKITNTDKFITF